jgi:hypothetical protein
MILCHLERNLIARLCSLGGMSNEPKTPAETTSNTEKDPSQWTTGGEPMTGAQKSYLKTLSDEAKEPFDDTLTKADASRRIEELQQQTGRGIDKQQRG